LGDCPKPRSDENIKKERRQRDFMVYTMENKCS